ncbi:phenylalanyl-tRNA synthetase beta chain [Dyadobacter jejuensis]|uniref:Phenylalanine--tRNA ligase beta subunit n=1 Tax=Dyadobacter jejuensis TaxID=1082580 RepID=A0A316ALU0_9BACT|nr:phenylalanine--tRNA ligase subunit beta [Dyadobacter jejuensis]PWJ58531.1 phenylalanyl-tRNA synthetase beta chain [Dyadobacter jejuensis]
MKISYKWLQEFVDFKESPEEISKILTSAGLEVEGIEEIESIKGGLKNVVVGQVLTCVKHPQADRLKLTTVDTGQGSPLSIVCGAPNVAAGQKVLVATIGAELYPSGSETPLVIKKSKIRGEVSEGMICAEDELGLGQSHDGILVLPEEVEVGTPASTYLSISSDFQIEIGLTPNRADAASHLGVARDLKAALNKPLTLPNIENFTIARTDAPVAVRVENEEACPRYAGLTIKGLKVGESPEWLRQRLQTIGVRNINNVVDVTNFVLHELGQPLHAFDLAKVTGNEIIVKTLSEGTRFTTLDEQERKLAATDLMICNQSEPMCIAGVFGGLESGVTESTTDIFLESAYFSPISVRKTAQNHSLKTDSSFRFERGTDPNMPIFALKRAAMLLIEVAGGEVSSEITDLYPHPIMDFRIPVLYRHIDRLIGKELGKQTILDILEGLDITVADTTELGFTAIVPPYRVDVQREADIIEEILRIYGFDQVELSDALSSSFISEFPTNDPEKLKLRIAEQLAAKGYIETINNSLTKPEWQASIAESMPGEPVNILNYLSVDLSVMRQTLLFSGLEVIAHNVNRRQKDLKLFEFGKIYFQKGEKYSEKEQLSLFLTGHAGEETWIEKSRDVVFHDLSGMVSQVLAVMKVKQLEQTPADPNIFSYGLTYTLNKKPLVSFGLLKPAIHKLVDVKVPVFMAEFDWDLLFKQYDGMVAFQEVVKFPEVRRDLSVVVDKQVTFQQLNQLARKTEKQLLRSVNVFDVYEGENLGGKKSYSLSFILQDEKQTLTDKVIEKTMQRFITTFEKELQATIRK